MIPRTMLAAETVQRAEQFWAEFFGCSRDDFGASRVLVVPHRGLAGYAGAWAFRYRAACVLSVPPTLVEKIAARVAGRSSDDLYREPAIREPFGAAVEAILGPCFVGYADHQTFRPAGAGAVRLGPTARVELERLAKACGEEWEHSAIDLERPPIFGARQDRAVVAAASYEIWGSALAHLGLVTHPRFRGHGHGKVVATAACADALERGLVLQWRTLEANRPSVAVARALGFERLASHYAVRLAPWVRTAASL